MRQRMYTSIVRFKDGDFADLSKLTLEFYFFLTNLLGFEIYIFKFLCS